MPDLKLTTSAARIRALMDEQGVSVTDLAAATGLDRAGLSRWLNGRSFVREDTLRAVLEALGASWGDLDG